MLVKYFKHGDKRSAFKARFTDKVGVKASISYQLGMTDANGDERNFSPEVLRGDVETYMEVTENGNFRNEYTAGVIRFVEKDIDMNILQNIMKEHEEMTYPGLEPHQFVALWILHKDKDGIELHFNYGKEELTTGKKLKPFIYDRDLDRIDAWKNYVNAKYDFADPSDPKYKQSFALSDNKLPADVKDVKGHLDEYIGRLIDANVVYDRETVIEALNKHEGIEVSRETKNAISVNVRGRKQPLRLKGQVYQEDFTKETLTAEYREELSSKYKKERPNRAEEEYKKAQKLWKKRAEENRAYYVQDKKELLKAEIKIAVEDLVIEGKVNDRKEIAEFIRNEYEQVEDVIENNKHHLSVKVKDNKRPFRLVDNFYKRDFDIPAYRESLNKEEEKSSKPVSSTIDDNNEQLRKRREEEEEYYFNKEYSNLDFVRLKDTRWDEITEDMLEDKFLKEQFYKKYVIIDNIEKETSFTNFDQSIQDRINGEKEKNYGREANYERNQRILREIVKENGREGRGIFGFIARTFESLRSDRKESRGISENITRASEAVEGAGRVRGRASGQLKRASEFLGKYRQRQQEDKENSIKSLNKLEDYITRMKKDIDNEKLSVIKKNTKDWNFDY